MKKILFWLMKWIPSLEAVIQCIYAQINEEKKRAIKQYAKHEPTAVGEKVMLSELTSAIREIGLEHGDLVLVHSSMSGLRQLQAAPAQIIKALLEIIGKDGTLAMAAFPYYREKDHIEKDGKHYIQYDVERTGVSTGLLPLVFCKSKDVIRSRCPFNTIAVTGKFAQEMLKDEMKAELAHGENSAWEYLVKHHAKILYLGLSVIEADTVVHVAEDMMNDSWPISNWYETQDYLVKDGNKEYPITLKIRNGFWHRFFTAHYSERLLEKQRFIVKKNVKGMKIEMIKDAEEYVSYLVKCAQQNKLLYKIPKKYRKKRNAENDASGKDQKRADHIGKPFKS